MLEIFVGVLAALLVRDVIRAWLIDHPYRRAFAEPRWDRQGNWTYPPKWQRRTFEKMQRLFGIQ